MESKEGLDSLLTQIGVHDRQSKNFNFLNSDKVIERPIIHSVIPNPNSQNFPLSILDNNGCSRIQSSTDFLKFYKYIVMNLPVTYMLGYQAQVITEVLSTLMKIVEPNANNPHIYRSD